MPRRLSLVALAALLVASAAGCGAAAYDQQKLEQDIEHDLFPQLMLRAPSGTTASPSVTCPKRASLRKGNVFYCNADITYTPQDPAAMPSGFQDQQQRIRVRVTSDSGDVHWEVVQ